MTPRRPSTGLRRIVWPAAAWALLFASACSTNMREQPRYRPLAESSFFPDGRSARPAVIGTVPRGFLRADEPFFTGKQNGMLVGTAPGDVTAARIRRGRERYDIFCSPCHGRLGDGQGMVVQRGFRVPPSLHIERLREAPDGHFFDVMTYGLGVMPAYGSRVPPEDRWAITLYIRALQLSRTGAIEDVPAEERGKLSGSTR